MLEDLPKHHAPQDPEELKVQIGSSDGSLIPLALSDKNGSPLFISSRYIVNPSLEDSPDAEALFYGWDASRRSLGAMSGVLLVDVYAEENGQLRPVGHMDWWLDGDYANGGGNMHSALAPVTDTGAAIVDAWGGRYNHRSDNIAFKVLPEHQGQQLGSLMLATSAVALNNVGVSRFSSGILLDPAVNTYAKFGITPKDFKDNHSGEPGDWKSRNLPIEALLDSPHIDEVMTHFTQPATYQQ